MHPNYFCPNTFLCFICFEYDDTYNVYWSVTSIHLESVLKILTSSGLMNYMNPQHIFVTVHDAVMYIQQQKVS